MRAGEVIPVDGIVTSQMATIDELALTGEPIPVVKARGAATFSGSLNTGETFEMAASSVAGESTYAGIVRLVTAAQTAKAPFVRLADRYALVFLPITLALAFIAWLISGDLIRSLAVLVAATPCPLILAAPVAFIAGVAQAARRGILVKGGGPLEALARAHTVLFDKTGTLTVGGARLLSIEVAPGETADEVLMLGASLEQASHHVLAAAIVQAAAERGLSLKLPEQVKESMGSGLHGVVDGRRVSAGSRDMILSRQNPPEWALRAVRRASWRSALIVFIAVEDKPIGALLLADELRSDTPRAVRMLRQAGIARIVMVTGDRAAAAQAIGAALDLDAVLADRVPSDKVDAVRSEQRLHPTIMVGDGINDAPALASADVGIALGARGASASSEAADVVILADRLDRVGDAITIAQRARRIAVESIIAGMSLSVLAMIAATVGWLAPVPAAIVQEVIDVVVILNALRALNPAHAGPRRTIPASVGREMRHDHVALIRNLDRLRSIADALDDVTPEAAAPLIVEANAVVQEQVVEHERDDEGSVYPQLAQCSHRRPRSFRHEPRAPRDSSPRAPACPRGRGPAVGKDRPVSGARRPTGNRGDRDLGAHPYGAGRGYLRGRRGALGTREPKEVGSGRQNLSLLKSISVLGIGLAIVYLPLAARWARRRMVGNANTSSPFSRAAVFRFACFCFGIFFITYIKLPFATRNAQTFPSMPLGNFVFHS